MRSYKFSQQVEKQALALALSNMALDRQAEQGSSAAFAYQIAVGAFVQSQVDEDEAIAWIDAEYDGWLETLTNRMPQGIAERANKLIAQFGWE